MQLAHYPGHKREWVQSPWNSWNESLAMSVRRREVGMRNTGKNQTRPTTDSHCLLQGEKLKMSEPGKEEKGEKDTLVHLG